MKNIKDLNFFQIEITSRSALPISRGRLIHFVEKILKFLKFKRAHVSICLVKDGAMRRWHSKLMNDGTTTDVLSLSQFEGAGSEPNPLNSLGDVIVCLDEAKRQAKVNRCSYGEEVCRYVLHGLLHCIGFDDIDPKHRKIMWALQEKLLKKYL